MAPRVSDEHKEERQAQILRAALACFGEKGCQKTTMRDICARAGLSAGAVYSYFDSKEAIIAAINSWCQQQNQAAFAAGAPLAEDDTPPDPREGMRQTLRAFLLRCKDPQFRAVLRTDAMFLAESLSNPTLMADYTRMYEDEIMARIVAGNREAQAAGALAAEVDPRALAEVLFSIVQGLHTQLLLNPQLDIVAYTRMAEAMVLGELWTRDTEQDDNKSR